MRRQVLAQSALVIWVPGSHNFRQSATASWAGFLPVLAELAAPPVAGLGTRDPPGGVPESGAVVVEEPGVSGRLGTEPCVPGRTLDGGKTSELERLGVIGPLGVG